VTKSAGAQKIAGRLMLAMRKPAGMIKMSGAFFHDNDIDS
jgi:hypothetical protein